MPSWAHWVLSPQTLLGVQCVLQTVWPLSHRRKSLLGLPVFSQGDGEDPSSDVWAPPLGMSVPVPFTSSLHLQVQWVTLCRHLHRLKGDVRHPSLSLPAFWVSHWTWSCAGSQWTPPFCLHSLQHRAVTVDIHNHSHIFLHGLGIKSQVLRFVQVSTVYQ